MTVSELDGGIRIHQFSSFLEQGVQHAFFTRQGGCSRGPFASLNFGGNLGDEPKDVLENHRKALGTVGRSLESAFDVWQVHGDLTVVTEKPRAKGEPHQRADGIITATPNLVLLMRFADCVPVMVADIKRNVVGIYHAGWQGTALKIGRKFIAKMCGEMGSKPQDLIAGIGPSICTKCYQVGEELVEKFAGEFGPRTSEIFSTHPDGIHLDLWKANQMTLEEAGVRNIEVMGACTAHNLTDWYSHRAEHGRTGRFGAVIWTQ